MSNEFRICDKCKATNVETLIPKLKKIDPEAKIVVGCQNFCGIGRTKSFAIVNHVPVIAENEEQLIQMIQEKLS